MGAFFLSHQNTTIDESKVTETYFRKGFKSPLKIKFGEYNLLLYKKQLMDLNNYYHNPEGSIYVCGSFFYKESNYEDSLSLLLNDFIKNIVDPQRLYGNYSILIQNKVTNQLAFIVDPSFIKNIYFDDTKFILSTDLLAIYSSIPDHYTVNRNAIIENITTGHLIGPDSYVNEIKKTDKINFFNLNVSFQDIQFHTYKPKIDKEPLRFSEAIENAGYHLDNYFKSVKALSDEYGAHIGLTGGFDSRLLLMFGKRHLKSLSTNSFWRPNSIEYINAKKLSEVAETEFFSFENNPFVCPEKETMLEKSFYFFDGQMRSQNDWIQEFNLPEYSEYSADKHYVGFHGCGGEQYRNADRMMRRISLKTYVKHEWMFKQCRNSFLNKDLEKNITENIKRKLKRLVEIPHDSISIIELKRIQNEVWNTANRATRVNLLNQQMFYFAPFTEYQISRSAYNYVPFLGNSLSFQIKLMKNLDPLLSTVPTNYGFTIYNEEPFKFKLIPFVFNLLPRKIFYFLYFQLKNFTKHQYDYNSFYKESDSELKAISKDVDLSKIGSNKYLGNLLVSADYFFKQIKKL